MTPAQAASKMSTIRTALRREIGKALTASAKNGRDIGRSLSGGGQTLKMLADMGHPYAVRHAATAARMGMSRRDYALKRWGASSVAADYIINRQTGAFQRAWKARGASRFSGGVLRAWVLNDSDVAGYLTGRNRPRSRMIRRPVDEQVVKLLRPIMADDVREAVRRALKA